MAIVVVAGEVIHLVQRADSASQRQAAMPIIASTTADKPQPQGLTCPDGIAAGQKPLAMPLTQVVGSDGKLWYNAPQPALDDKGGWFFHFSAFNSSRDFCVTSIEYEVELESDNGSLLIGHGKKHISPLSPGYVYTAHERDNEDEVRFEAKPRSGALNSWKITKVYGFQLIDPFQTIK
jgi:hypothetical protein